MKVEVLSTVKASLSTSGSVRPATGEGLKKKIGSSHLRGIRHRMKIMEHESATHSENLNVNQRQCKAGDGRV